MQDKYEIQLQWVTIVSVFQILESKHLNVRHKTETVPQWE